jgi:LuxR family maltose regulon positive regulatory protein
LDSSAEKRVIYIHAPAGFGKTVSSTLWLTHRESKTNAKRAWVHLDEYDNKTSEFYRRFVSALVCFEPDNFALCELANHPLFHTAAIEFTLQALGLIKETNNECILVLDDLHIITNPEVLNVLPVMIKRLPDNFTVMLLSRTAPGDYFSEMVVKDELGLINAEHLQLTGNEIKLLFEENGRTLTPKQANDILHSTGGWVMGARALLLSDEKTYNVKLSGRYLERFIRTHVWERWDEQVKFFMSYVSVAEELTPELCDTLIGGKMKISSAGMLARLAHENAFLRETENKAYRFHDLFREFLLHTLKEHGEKTAAKQYERTGDFFYRKKDYFRAVEYYMRGVNIDGAAKAFYHMYDYNSSYTSIEDTLYTIHTALNDAIVEKHPFLLEVQAWAAFVEGRAAQFETYLDKYKKLSPKIIVSHPRSALIRLLLKGLDYRSHLIDVIKSWRFIPFKGSIKAPTPSVSQNLPYFHRSFRDFSDCFIEMDKNMPMLKKTIGIIFDDEYNVMEECLYAGYYYETGSFGPAYEHALAAVTKISQNCSPEIRFCAKMILASVLYADRQITDAEKIIADIKTMIENSKAYYLNHNLKAFECRVKLNNGDKTAAKEWLDKHDENPSGDVALYKLYRHFTSVRAHIVLGNYTRAILILQKLLHLSQRYNRPLDTVEALLLLTISHRKMERNGASAGIKYLEQAITLAHKYNYTQIFANEGAELSNILYKMQNRAVQKKYINALPGGFVKTLHIAAFAASKHSKGLTGGRMSGIPTFTAKQKEVMRLLCEGFSRNEIAESLGLKPYTVKSHLELIYKKLDAANSVDAVIKINSLAAILPQ